MARYPSLITHVGQYAALRIAAATLNVFDIEHGLRSARAIGSMMHRLDRRHRERILQNIRRALPELPEQRVEFLAERSAQHFLQLGVEVLFTPRLVSRDTWAERVRLHRLSEALDLLLSGRPTLLVTGHFGNWELLGYVLATVGLDMDAIARPIDNPLVNRWLLDVRERQGMRIITKFGATDRMTRVLEEGGTLGFIGDQNAGDRGLFVPFFGRLASAYKSIGLLALNYNAPVICGYARRLNDRFRFEIGASDIIYPRDWADQPDPLYYLTARYTRAIERMVRLAPDQYLWLHRRWKSRPRHEREGKPMPAALRRKLESLPWLDGEQIELIDNPLFTAASPQAAVAPSD
jgi:KDO2-lipid IV(A) lauroyltransferase